MRSKQSLCFTALLLSEASSHDRALIYLLPCIFVSTYASATFCGSKHQREGTSPLELAGSAPKAYDLCQSL